MIGETISHYRIVAKLGAGGMGVVYQAVDKKLKRTVALKFLPAPTAVGDEDKARFLREAQAAAALNHPNICTIHEIDEDAGRTFIVMECVEGLSLKEKLAEGPLAIEEALDLAIQIGRGLKKAHENGIVHRDIKPANIMIDAEGTAKIMDFGLAMTATATRLTRDGTTLGTAGYMSPEQAQGEELDHRTDIWSLGVLLYEMLAGRIPFRGQYESALMYAIVHQEIEPLQGMRADAPAGLDGILSRALAKERKDRYGEMGELLAHLEAVAQDSRAVPTIPLRPRKPWHQRGSWQAVLALVAILAVFAVWQLWPRSLQEPPLPEQVTVGLMGFKNISGDPDQDYFSAGVTDAILGRLSKIASIRVLSLMRLDEMGLALPELVAEYAIDVLLEGSAAKSEGQFRITARLLEAENMAAIWSEDYEGELRDILSQYNEVARTLAGSVEAGLTPTELLTLGSAREIDPKAYELVLRGEQLRMHYGDEEWSEGVGYYQQATRIEPTYAPAWEGLAFCYFRQADHTGPVDDYYPQAKANIERALEMNDSFGLAHATLGSILMLKYDWRGAEEAFNRALQLDPNNPQIHGEYSTFLAYAARFTEAIAEAELEAELDPLATSSIWRLAWIYLSCRRYDESITEAERQLQRFPGAHSNHLRGLRQIKAWSHEMKREWEEVMTFSDEHEKPLPVAYLDEVGKRGEALTRIESKKLSLDETPSGYDLYAYFRSYYIALDYADLGMRDSCLIWLERTAEQCPEKLRHLNVDGNFDYLRTEPRFQAILKQFNIPQGELTRLIE